MSLSLSRFQIQIAILFGSGPAKLKATTTQSMLVGLNRTTMHPAVLLSYGKRNGWPKWANLAYRAVIKEPYFLKSRVPMA